MVKGTNVIFLNNRNNKLKAAVKINVIKSTRKTKLFNFYNEIIINQG